MSLLRGHSRGDEGTVLILALAFLGLFGLVVGTILGLATTNLKSTTVVRNLAATTYTADGAVDGAINAARSQPTVGQAGYNSTCFSLAAGAVNSAAQVDVRCTGQSGSGTTTTPFLAGASTPAQAVLAPNPATDPAEGLALASGSVARVQGPVAVARTLNEGTLSMLTTSPAAYSPVTAQSCTGVGVVTPVPSCAATTPADPGYAPSLDMTSYLGRTGVVSTLPTWGTVPTCNANKVATFSPGMYTSLTAINTLMTSCAGGAFWFQPGYYYFDFLDTTGTGLSHDWTFNDVNADLVGGKALGWTPSAFVATGAAQVPYPSTDATATTSACDPTAPGVLFVFGNDSRFTLSKGHVQLCAYNVSTTAQHLAVWTPAADTTVSGSTADIAVATNPTDTTGTGGVAWTNPDNGSVIGTLLANVTANATVPSSLGEAAGQYTFPTAQIPPNATITGLTARVFETLTGTGRSTFTFKPPTGTAAVTRTVHDCTAGCTGPTYSTATETEVTFPLPANATSAAAIVNGMAWTYSVTGATSYIDGVNFSVNYTFVARAPTGVLSAHPYLPGSATTDAVLAVAALATTDRPVLAVHGTVYVPKAAVSFVQTGVGNDLVDRGVIAREVYLGLASPATAYTGPHLSIPTTATTTTPRLVVFTASSGGVDQLRAEVQFTDSSGTVDGTIPKVLTWSLQ